MVSCTNRNILKEIEESLKRSVRRMLISDRNTKLKLLRVSTGMSPVESAQLVLISESRFRIIFLLNFQRFGSPTIISVC